LLKDLNRKIDDYQTKYLIDQWNKTNYSPLYLKIAIEEVKKEHREEPDYIYLYLQVLRDTASDNMISNPI
jgi:hypothetical protein